MGLTTVAEVRRDAEQQLSQDVESTGIDAVDKQFEIMRRNTLVTISKVYSTVRGDVGSIRDAVAITDANVKRVFDDNVKFQSKTTSAIEELQRDLNDMKLRQQLGGNKVDTTSPFTG